MRAAQFCTSCGKVQPPQPVDYFSFFGLPRELNIDASRIEREFYALSRKLHPDIYAGGDGREQEWSLEQSSRLNDAYRTLKDPIRRTEYLLKLEGVELEGQSKAATEAARTTGEKKQIVPPDLLEEVFELNMQLEEARANKKIGEQDAALTADASKLDSVVFTTSDDVSTQHGALTLKKSGTPVTVIGSYSGCTMGAYTAGSMTITCTATDNPDIDSFDTVGLTVTH